MLRRRARRVVILAAGLAVCAAAQEPSARNPLPDFLYSIDLASPEIVLLGLDAGDILTQGIRDGAPLQVFDRTLHGLFSPNDQVDGLSTIQTIGPLRPPARVGHHAVGRDATWLSTAAHGPRAVVAGPLCGEGSRPRGFNNDDCIDATPLGIGFPLFDTTLDASLDVVPACLPFAPGSPGVWFRVVGDGATLTATTCTPARTFDTAISVYCGVCPALACIAGNDDAGGACQTASTARWCSIAGETYSILVFGSGAAAGNFEILVTSDGVPCAGALPCGPCVVPCAPSEPEPPCFDGSVDTSNGGCNSTPPVFTPISCGQTVCGTAGTFLSGGQPTRDTDWHLLELDQPSTVVWTVTAEFPVLAGFVQLPCPQNAFFGEPVLGAPCETVSVTQSLAAGSWALFVSTADFRGVPCGARYQASVDCFATPGFAILFSVDRDSVGGPPPEPSLVAVGLPFNVTNQAAKNQEAGDVFVSLLDFTRAGPVPPSRSIAYNNTLVFNQGDSGGSDTELDPDFVSPETPVPPGTPLGGIYGGMGAGPAPLTGGSASAARGLQPFFFSVSNNSPSLGLNNGAVIFVDLIPNAPGGENVYASRPQLQLRPGDDIDGLIVFDDGDLVFQPNNDQVLFSLARNSPTLVLTGRSGADIFTTNPIGPPTVFCAFHELGLSFGDEVTMLDWVPCNDILACVLDWGIGFVCPIPGCAGDVNGDCLVDLSDLTALLSHFGSPSGGLRANGDLDSDGDVDLDDLTSLLSTFGTDCNLR